MLVLSRHRDETIVIGDEIELTVVDIRGDKVRLGIKAPSHIAVHRKEVYEAIRRENEQSAALRAGEFESIQPPIKPAAKKGSSIPPAARVQNPSSADKAGKGKRRTA